MIRPHRLVKHRSARSIVRAFLGEGDVFPEHPSDPGSGPMTAKEARSSILGQRVWAFVRIPGGRHFLQDPRVIIHWWAAKDCPLERIAMALGHELGHSSDEVLDDDAAEERRADGYADVVLAVLNILGRRPG